MTREEFEKMTDDQKLNYINQYIGDTMRFSKENNFSWTTAIKLTRNAVKINGQYVFGQDQEDENVYELLFKLQRGERLKYHLNLNKEVVEMLEKESQRTQWTKTEIVNYCLYKYLKERDHNE